MARVTPEAAAKDIVHFAILGESGRTGGFFRYKKPIPWYQDSIGHSYNANPTAGNRTAN
jgi:hypothetical protein